MFDDPVIARVVVIGQGSVGLPIAMRAVEVGFDKDLAVLPITRHEFHGEWNYTLTPKTAQSNVW